MCINFEELSQCRGNDLINLICKVTEEIKCILLLSDINGLPPQFELLPEALGRIVLQLALQQVAKNTLQLW